MEDVIKWNENKNKEKKKKEKKRHKIHKIATGYLQTHSAMQWKYVVLSAVLTLSAHLMWSDKY